MYCGKNPFFNQYSHICRTYQERGGIHNFRRMTKFIDKLHSPKICFIICI